MRELTHERSTRLLMKMIRACTGTSTSGCKTLCRYPRKNRQENSAGTVRCGSGKGRPLCGRPGPASIYPANPYTPPTKVYGGYFDHTSKSFGKNEIISLPSGSSKEQYALISVMNQINEGIVHTCFNMVRYRNMRTRIHGNSPLSRGSSMICGSMSRRC